jgi:hypothetical protein
MASMLPDGNEEDHDEAWTETLEAMHARGMGTKGLKGGSTHGGGGRKASFPTAVLYSRPTETPVVSVRLSSETDNGHPLFEIVRADSPSVPTRRRYFEFRGLRDEVRATAPLFATPQPAIHISSPSALLHLLFMCVRLHARSTSLA